MVSAERARDGAVFAVFVAAALLAGFFTQWMAGIDGRCIASGVVVFGLLWASRRRFGSVLLSPVQIVGGGVFLLAILGRWLYEDVADASAGGSITIHLSDVVTERTQFLMLVAAASILLGGQLGFAFFGGHPKREATNLRVTLSQRSLDRLAVVTPLPLLMLVVTYGPESMIRRSFYIAEHVANNPGLTLATTIAIPAVAGLGYLWGARSHRIWTTLLTIGYLLAFLGLGSRRLALIPILFAAGFFAARGDRRARLLILGAAVLSTYLIGLPLELRAQTAHGIGPYLAALPHILGGGLPWSDTARNLLISYALIGETAFAFGHALPLHDIGISLNPLPGSMAGWYAVAQAHRLNDFTPTAGLGELGNAGWGVAIGVCVGFGVVLAWIDVRSKKLVSEGRQFFALALILLSVLFLLLLTQYNLRSATRMLYYAIALDVVARVLTSRAKSRRERLADRPASSLGGRPRVTSSTR